MAPPKAYVFDAYATLFDVHSVIGARPLSPAPN
jgi:FMN phosphatase YigB (HAD superfamily)